MPDHKEIPYWSLPDSEVLKQLGSSPDGITSAQAASKSKEYGENVIKSRGNTSPLLLFFNQFKNPIMIILIVATVISGMTGDLIDSAIIFAIILGSVFLSFLQEYSAGNVVAKLRSQIQSKSTVLRDGKPVDMPSSVLVPGDIVMLSAGSLIPADGLILECDNLNVNQSVLTGEAFPVEKRTGAVGEGSSLTERTNCVFMGTNVHSGSAKLLIVQTGIQTNFGQIAKDLDVRQPETEFEHGVRRFGYLLTEMMLVLTLVVFAINVIFKKPAIDSLLFSVALAVGITPQLLPAIININLAQGSRKMARDGVIVRHLTSIENFGSMDVLCTDKTGTLTEGAVHLSDAVDVGGKPSPFVFRAAFLNASLQTGLVNALDAAIIDFQHLDTGPVKKQDEIPYDFTRKRLSVIVQEDAGYTLVTKGALSNILDICDQFGTDTAAKQMDPSSLDRIHQLFTNWSAQGFRVLGIAQKGVPFKEKYNIDDEHSMIFIGFLLFFDPPKPDVAQTILDLAGHGVQLRVITGDNRLAAMHTANAVGLKVTKVLTGADLLKLNNDALWKAVEGTNLFAEVDPSQKERIILAIKKNNHVVGYMGDGINDAPALHAADVSISVNTAVDVAKESADFVLLEKSLAVLKRGIELGRITFSNTLKYIYITTSANFGNMFSMAGASLFMPFLPLLPKQILLINFMTDFPAMTIANDAVDADMLKNPRRWDIKAIRNFMFTFGLISSAFDYLTFAVLLIGFKASQDLFQSGWFVLSILTELLVLLVMRTQKPFFKSKPAPMLLFSTIGIGLITLALPYLPLKNILGITPIPLPVLLALMGVALLYILVTEVAKHFFYRIKPKSKR